MLTEDIEFELVRPPITVLGPGSGALFYRAAVERAFTFAIL